MSATERPLRAPATAAAMPAGPPPTTTRSATHATGIRPAGSSMKSGVVVMSGLLCSSRTPLGLPQDVPFQHAALDQRNDAEEQGGKCRSDDDGGVEQRRIEIV